LGSRLEPAAASTPAPPTPALTGITATANSGTAASTGEAAANVAQTIELANILREDVVQPSLSADEALANAPERSGGHFVVPAILGGGEGGA